VNNKNRNSINGRIAEIGTDIDFIKNKRILFGHMSVGDNILSGIKHVAFQNSKKINIIPVNIVPEQNKGFLAHMSLGKNGNPGKKCDLFEIEVDSLAAHGLIDIAVMKFCYADISQNTNINELFEHYRNMTERIKNKYPHVTLIHMTVPLVARNSAWKSAIKKIIGREDAAADNIKRNDYNKIILTRLKGEPVFDLASAEATFPDGSMCADKKNGREYLSLATLYTSDGGHLNDLGSRTIAGKFLTILAQACK
jgi:hypothetical protein